MLLQPKAQWPPSFPSSPLTSPANLTSPHCSLLEGRPHYQRQYPCSASQTSQCCCPPYGWHLVEECAFEGTGKQPLCADGALVDELTLVHGLWEARDSDDDLRREIKSKSPKARLRNEWERRRNHGRHRTPWESLRQADLSRLNKPLAKPILQASLSSSMGPGGHSKSNGGRDTLT